MTNMDLWNAVSTTDPKNTKHINQRGGFTAITAYSQIQAATEQFGPVGKGWGWEIVEFTYPPNDTMIVHLRMWHKDMATSFSVCGQASLYTKGADPKPDDDCAKKAVTDGITKGLSYLGFNADVFLGKFDDNKYVESLKNGKPSDKWHGPLNKTALKEKLRQLDKNMRHGDCADEGALTGIIIDYATAVDQAKKDLPDWHKAYLDAIATKRETFEPSKLGSG